MLTICLTCRESTGVGEEIGYAGLPSLDETPRGRGRHRLSRRLSPGGDADSDETFGCIYSGFRAIGLLTHPLEEYRGFLEAHTGEPHRLYSWQEGDHELPKGFEGIRHKLRVYKRPRRAPGYVRARVRFSCPECRDAFESDGEEWVRPFAPKALAASDVQLFRKRTGRPSEFNVHEHWPFDITLFDDLEDWFAKHTVPRESHSVRIELLRDDLVRLEPAGRSGQARARGAPPSADAPGPAVAAWQPAEARPQDHERYLGDAGPEARPWLVGLRDPDPEARARAASELGRLRRAPALGYLVSMLEDPEPRVREAAVAAIATMPDPRTVRALGCALGDEDEAVRAAARAGLEGTGASEDEALGQARTPRGPYDSVPNPDKLPRERASLEAGLRDPRAGRRHAALGVVVTERAAWAVDLLLLAAVDPHRETRSVAAYALGERKDSRVVPALLESLRDYASGPAATAALALGRRKSAEALAPLLAAMGLPSPELRAAAAQALGEIGDTGAVPVLAEALDDPHEPVRAQATIALAHIKGEAATVALATLLLVPDERAGAFATLAARGDKAAVPALIVALRDSAAEIRREAAAVLCALDDPRGRDALVEAARRGDADVAAGAHELLLAEGDSTTEPTLLRACDEGRGTQLMAMRFLKSGNPRLEQAGQRALGARKPIPGLRSIPWGSGRSRP